MRIARLSPVVLIGCATVCAADGIEDVGKALQDAAERAKQAAAEVREAWHNAERPCADCGRPVHVGARCAACAAKRASATAQDIGDGLRRTAEAADRHWQEAAHPCARCGRTVHVGRLCPACAADAVQAGSRQACDALQRTWEDLRFRYEEAARPCADCGALTHYGLYCLPCHSRRAEALIRPHVEAARRNYAQYCADHEDEWRDQMEGYGRGFRELAEPSAEGLERLREFNRLMRRIRDDLVITALKLVPAVDPVTREITPLDAVARRITDVIAVGGDLGEDPVAFGYHAMSRHGWLAREARLVPLPDGSWVSIAAATSDPVAVALSGTEQGRAIQRLREELGNLLAAFESDDPVEFTNSGLEIRRALNDLAKANARGAAAR